MKAPSKDHPETMTAKELAEILLEKPNALVYFSTEDYLSPINKIDVDKITDVDNDDFDLLDSFILRWEL